VIVCTAVRTSGAVVAAKPAASAAALVVSAGRVFGSPGIETATRPVAWRARGVR